MCTSQSALGFSDPQISSLAECPQGVIDTRNSLLVGLDVEVGNCMVDELCKSVCAES